MKRKEIDKEGRKELGPGKLIQDKYAPKLHQKSEKKVPEENRIQGQSKQEKLINLLKQPDGTTIEEMAKVTGWQHHSIRGVISGALRKRLGLSVLSRKNGQRGRIYRIGA